MENINTVVAENLKRLREQRKLSLDTVAGLSGVSKSMLSQIERGDVSPTISTIWKITVGLKISFTDLMSRPEAECEVIDKSSVQPILEDGGKCRDYPLFPFDSSRRFEIFRLEMEPGGRINSEPHMQGTQEFLTVFSGTLSVNVNETVLTAGSGGAMRFKADCPHSYENTGSDLCKICAVIYYPE